MEAVKKALQSHHHGFPVINTAGRLVGLIGKNMLCTIIEKKAFYNKENTDRAELNANANEESPLNEDPPLINTAMNYEGDKDDGA